MLAGSSHCPSLPDRISSACQLSRDGCRWQLKVDRQKWDGKVWGNNTVSCQWCVADGVRLEAFHRRESKRHAGVHHGDVRVDTDVTRILH